MKKTTQKKKTRQISFNEIKMSEYLFSNIKTSTSKTIFRIRSKTLDLKNMEPMEI